MSNGELMRVIRISSSTTGELRITIERPHRDVDVFGKSYYSPSVPTQGRLQRLLEKYTPTLCLTYNGPMVRYEIPYSRRWANGQEWVRWTMNNTQKAVNGTVNDQPSQIIKDLAKQIYNHGVRRGRDECLAYLRGAMGRTSPWVSDLDDYLGGLANDS